MKDEKKASKEYLASADKMIRQFGKDETRHYGYFKMLSEQKGCEKPHKHWPWFRKK